MAAAYIRTARWMQAHRKSLITVLSVTLLAIIAISCATVQRTVVAPPEIPGAEFVELDSRNHILLEHEPAWQRFQDEVLAFMQAGETSNDAAFAALSARERQVLALMADGLSNADIADRLTISEKTVRNHASNLFDKLGVWSRAQAIVFARDRGYSG